MNSDEFYQSRQQDWETLNSFVERAQRDLRQLTPQEIDQFASLYRAVSSDLALARRDFPRHRVTHYLNQLVARSHAVLYQGEPVALHRLVEFITSGFPRLYRETFLYTFIAFLMFAVPALGAGISTAINPQSAQELLPAQVQSVIPGVQNKQLWIDTPAEERPVMSSFIMQNNIRVAFLAFSSGLTGGIMTLWVLVENGLIFGGLLGVTSYYGIGSQLLSFVIGHGVLELSVIFIAGGSGLMLGWAILHPGLMRRRDALIQAGQKSIRLLMGAVPLLVVAGTIEGFISPSETIPWEIKAAVGIGSGILLYSYLFLAGRGKQAAENHNSVFPLNSR